MVLTTLYAALALAQAPATTAQTFYRAAQGNERKVSLRVDDASLKDVLSKLPKVDYVVDADAFKARRITLSLTDVTTTEALDAIAAAIDAHWETVGGVRVLKKGAGFGINSTGFHTFTFPSTKDFPSLNGKSFRALPPDAFKNLFKDGKTMPGLTPERTKEMQRALEEARKSLEDSRGEFEKAMERARLRGEGLRGPMGEETRKALERSRAGGDGAAHLDMDVDALLKSITPAQKELAKSQGYLKISDLTPEQRKMTGHDGTIEIRITRNGETLSIKNG